MTALWMVPCTIMMLLTHTSREPAPLVHQDDSAVDGAPHPHGLTHLHLQDDGAVDGTPCLHGVTHLCFHGACTPRPPG